MNFFELNLRSYRDICFMICGLIFRAGIQPTTLPSDTCRGSNDGLLTFGSKQTTVFANDLEVDGGVLSQRLVPSIESPEAPALTQFEA